MPNTVGRYWDKLRSTIGKEPSVKDYYFIAVVSGLPRSGTSMMMKMLEAGGIPPLTDEIRAPDVDNPEGYYEFERVKKLGKGDTAWLEDAQGKSVKIIAALLKNLPPDYYYQVIFMRREMDEVLRSQKQMLERRGEPTHKVEDQDMAALFKKHLDDITAWLGGQPNFEVIYVSYNDVLQKPDEQARRINQFFGERLNVEKMASVVDRNLYRQRQ